MVNKYIINLMSFKNLQKNREGNSMASFKMSCFDLSHRINLFYFDERSECRNNFLSTNLMKKKKIKEEYRKYGSNS